MIQTKKKNLIIDQNNNYWSKNQKIKIKFQKYRIIIKKKKIKMKSFKKNYKVKSLSKICNYQKKLIQLEIMKEIIYNLI